MNPAPKIDSKVPQFGCHHYFRLHPLVTFFMITTLNCDSKIMNDGTKKESNKGFPIN